jgi:radical SAM superfamily enzyme YgiQ (UPF0313 family)
VNVVLIEPGSPGLNIYSHVAMGRGVPEPTCAPARSFEAGADFVIRGEAEQSLLMFLDAVCGWQPGEPPSEALRQVPGIVWRQDGDLRFGPPPRQLARTELDALPFVDMSLVDGAERQTTGLVWRSRGCPERCTFCEVHEIWPRYVLRDERISVEELLRCQEAGFSSVFLIDDNAAANKPSFKRFLQGAIDRGYARPLTVQLRADAVFDEGGRLDRELLRLLREAAPVTTVCIGVESAADEDLAGVQKRIDVDRVATALTALRRYGVLVHGMFIAFAHDTLETLKRNGGFARRYVTSLQYLFETPLPGTRATAEHEATGRVIFDRVEDLRFLDGMHVAIRPYRTTARQMQEAVIAEYKQFYSRIRIAKAFVEGLVVRHRRLGAGMRRYLRGLKPSRRIAEWARMHLQYKFAPCAVLCVGRRRVRAFLRDPEYTAYLRALQD